MAVFDSRIYIKLLGKCISMSNVNFNVTHIHSNGNRGFNKVLIFQPNTTIQIQYSNLLLHTATAFGYPDQPSSGKC